jgi:hypothetical protein
VLLDGTELTFESQVASIVELVRTAQLDRSSGSP